jgi:potassium large conductance calcium-activated channel subfamily M alpha protein 1
MLKGLSKKKLHDLNVKVSGHITFETVTSFLSDFHHKDREDVDVEAVFLHPDEPELEFQGFLKKQYPRVRYYQVNSIPEHAITR